MRQLCAEAKLASCGARDLRGGVGWEGDDGTDVDFAKHVGVDAISGTGPVEEVRVPQDGKVLFVDVDEATERGYPVAFKPDAQSCELGLAWVVHRLR